MAYMSQEKKAEIAANLKKIMPRDWKWSLSVRHHSTLVLTIQEAPVDLIGEYAANAKANEYKPDDYWTREHTHLQVNTQYINGHFQGKRLELFEKIKTAMMDGNHDRSDIMTDYFDVGWYIDINFGRWNKPFRFTGRKIAA